MIAYGVRWTVREAREAKGPSFRYKKRWSANGLQLTNETGAPDRECILLDTSR